LQEAISELQTLLLLLPLCPSLLPQALQLQLHEGLTPAVTVATHVQQGV
jgi:hypothetical protein